MNNEIDNNELAGDFKNVSTSFYTLFKRLNEYLQQRPIMPMILNPVLAEEDLTSRNWNQNKYENFRDKINLYFNKVEED